LRILRIRTLINSSIIRGFLFGGMSTTFFLGALYLEGVLGFSPIRTGLGFLPMALMMGLLSSGITARLTIRFGNKTVLIPGMVAGTAGLLLLTRIGPDASYFRVVFPALALIGLGAGLSFVPLLAIAMIDVPKADAGLGSGIVNVSMQVAGALGLAVLGTMATDRTRSLEAAGRSAASALSSGYRLSFFIAAVSVAIGLVMALVLLHEPPVVSDSSEVVLRTEMESTGESLTT
jgi:MFS family permease